MYCLSYLLNPSFVQTIFLRKVILLKRGNKRPTNIALKHLYKNKYELRSKYELAKSQCLETLKIAFTVLIKFYYNIFLNKTFLSASFQKCLFVCYLPKR